eukprot:10186450-Ditylum_brightwellii.AAC.1
MVKNVMRKFDVPLKEHDWLGTHKTYLVSDFTCGNQYGIMRNVRPQKIHGRRPDRWGLRIMQEMLWHII